jgi:outer membrane protein assembly factor BamD (BamD/ComL family)
MARKAEALPQLGRLLAEYPQSGYAGEAQDLIQELEKEGVKGPPGPSL